MKRKWVIGVAAVLLIAVLFAIAWPREKEPEYQGKKLSEWISKEFAINKQGASNAVIAIGTNNLPLLVNRACRGSSGLSDWLVNFSYRAPSWLVQNRPAQWLLKDRVGERVRQAWTVFAVIGELEQIAPEFFTTNGGER